MRGHCCLSELGDKEVIKINDGCRLGYVTDVQVNICDGRLTAIVVTCDGALFNFRRNEVVVPWENIDRIGDDIILVRCKIREEIDEAEHFEKRRGRRFFF